MLGSRLSIRGDIIKLKDKIKKWSKLESDILNELSGMESSGRECSCLDKEVIKVVDDGNLLNDEIITLCIKCGGYVE